MAARSVAKTRSSLRPAKILSRYSGQPVEKIHADSDRDHWLRADEAVAYGLIDEVVTRA